MNIEEATGIDDLVDFTNRQILSSVKYRCVRDDANPDLLVYKIKIGRMIFTIKILPEDPHFPLDDSTKRKLAKVSMEFLIARLRRRIGLYPNTLSN